MLKNKYRHLIHLLRFRIIQINVRVVIDIINKFLETRYKDQRYTKDSLETTSRG